MTFHPLAKNVLRKHLDKILSGIALDTDRKFLFEHYDFDAMTHLVREILKTKGDYLRERDIFEIILGNIFREVRHVENQFPPTAPIIFRNLLGEELSNALIDKIIKDIFTKYEKFFNAEDDDKNVERIKTAIEWAFDSKINENKTFAYIQTCIALDSILGKEDSDEQRSLTETVADRGSYLLGKNIEERKKYYLQLRKLLKVRGKLVHGRNLRLIDEDRECLLLGQGILNGVIMKELSYL